MEHHEIYQEYLRSVGCEVVHLPAACAAVGVARLRTQKRPQVRKHTCVSGESARSITPPVVFAPRGRFISSVALVKCVQGPSSCSRSSKQLHVNEYCLRVNRDVRYDGVE